MIVLKSSREIELMRHAGQIAGEALALGGELVKPGVTTKHINDMMERYIRSKGGKPSFKGYGGFPAAACISINEQVIHGIPSNHTVIQDGDIVSIDVGVLLNGYHGDTAATFGAGKISDQAQKLIDVTKQSFFEGIKYAVDGNRLGDVGHGVGTQLHEEPNVPNYGVKGKGKRLQSGMTIAVEPMINEGTESVKTLRDGWTVVTIDGKLSAHYEHTIAITENEPLILTSL